MATIRLTAAQAMVRFLSAQQVELDGRKQRLFEGVFAIFGHGNVAGIGEALYAARDALLTYRAHNEQAMAHAAVAPGNHHCGHSWLLQNLESSYAITGPTLMRVACSAFPVMPQIQMLSEFGQAQFFEAAAMIRDELNFSESSFFKLDHHGIGSALGHEPHVPLLFAILLQKGRQLFSGRKGQ